MREKADQKDERPHAAEDKAPAKFTAGERRQRVREAKCEGCVSQRLVLVLGIRRAVSTAELSDAGGPERPYGRLHCAANLESA